MNSLHCFSHLLPHKGAVQHSCRAASKGVEEQGGRKGVWVYGGDALPDEQRLQLSEPWFLMTDIFPNLHSVRWGNIHANTHVTNLSPVTSFVRIV